ncbi:MAG TPA: hypothetical protein VIK95_06805 [Egibacteraceae bacterium]
MARHAVLWGRDHPRLGTLVSRELDTRAAVAMSAGVRPKPYPSDDANEDVVLVARGATATLLAVADGSRGHEAAHAAGAALLAAADAVRAEPDAVRDLLARVDGCLDRLRRTAPAAARSSRTALTVAVAGAGRVVAATRGDTALVRVRDGDCRLLSGVAPGAAAPLPQPQVSDTRPGDWLVVASDGVFDHLDAAWPQTLAAACGRGRPVDAAVRVVAAACAAGAGDNVSVGVLAVGGTTG